MGNLVSEEKFQFRENLVSEKSLGFRKFGIVKKVTVSVSVKILVSSFSGVHLIDVTLVVEERVIDVVADITGVRDGLEVDIG